LALEQKPDVREAIDMMTDTVAELRKSGGVDRLGAATSLLLLGTIVAELDGITDALTRIESRLQER